MSPGSGCCHGLHRCLLSKPFSGPRSRQTLCPRLPKIPWAALSRGVRTLREDELTVIARFARVASAGPVGKVYLLSRSSAISPPGNCPDANGLKFIPLFELFCPNARIYLPQTNRQISKEPTSWLLSPSCRPNAVLTRLMSANLDIALHVSIYAAASPLSDDLRDGYSLTYPTI